MGLIRKKAGVEHIDTNIIIRLITRDDEKMTKKAEALVSKTNKVYVFEDAAMMEVIFVLSGAIYHRSREQVRDAIKTIMNFDNIFFNKSLIGEALNLYVAHPKLSFVDCYLAAATIISGETPLWTLDHKLAAQCKVAKAL